MSLLIREFHDLIFDGGTISGSGSLYITGKQRGSVYIFPDDLMGMLIGIGKPAGYLLSLYIPGLIGK